MASSQLSLFNFRKNSRSSKEVLDLQIFVDNWSYEGFNYVNLLYYLEGELLNLDPNINYLFQAEYKTSLSELKPKLKQGLLEDLKLAKTDFAQINEFLESIYADFQETKDLKKLLKKIQAVLDFDIFLDLSEEKIWEVYSFLITEIKDNILDFSFYSEKSVPQILVYQLENKIYWQFKNLPFGSEIYQITKEDLQKFLKILEVNL